MWFEPHFVVPRPVSFPNPATALGLLWAADGARDTALHELLTEADCWESLVRFLVQDRLAASELLRQFGVATRVGASVVFAAVRGRSDADADVAGFG